MTTYYVGRKEPQLARSTPSDGLTRPVASAPGWWVVFFRADVICDQRESHEEVDMLRQLHYGIVSRFRQSNWQWSVVVAAWISLLAAPLGRGQSEVNRSRFLAEYQPRAALIEQRYSNVFFDLITTGDAGDKQHISQLIGKFNRRNFLLKNKSYKLVQKDTGKVLNEYEYKEGEAVSCRNALYSFALRPGNGGEHVLHDLKIYNVTHETAFCYMTAPYASWEDKRTYLDIAQDPKTQITSFMDCLWQGKPMKVLECKFSIIHPSTHKLVEVSRNFYFAPNDVWICRGLDSGSDPKNAEYLEEIYFYEPESGQQLPKLKRLEKWLRNKQNPRESKLLSATDITEFRRASEPFPDSDFKLSSFGLPEPMGVKQPEQSRAWVWLLAATAVSAALAVLFAWLKRRSLKARTRCLAPSERRTS
jgi:hypothetical protein